MQGRAHRREPRFFVDFPRDGRAFDHPPPPAGSGSFTPRRRSAATAYSPYSLADSHAARPEHVSGSSGSPPVQAPTHFGHQSPWAAQQAQPTGSFPAAAAAAAGHFQRSTPPSYPVGDTERHFRHDYFAIDIDRPVGSPHSTGRSDISGSPTLGERTPPTSQAALPAKLLSNLSAEQQRIVKDADPAHQQVIMDILTSSDFGARDDIPAEKLQIFYTSVPHARSEGDKQGSRGGAAGYACRWHACPQAERTIKRRDHMLNHIRGHFGVKPFACKYGNGFHLPKWCVPRSPSTPVSFHSSP